MTTLGMIFNGGVEVAPPAPPPPAVTPAPPPPQLPPSYSAPTFDPALLAAAGVTAEQAAAADLAGNAAAAAAAALLSGEGSQGIAAAAQAAGATPDVVQGLIDLGLPDITSLLVGGTGGADSSVGLTDDLDASAALANANRPDLSNLPEWELIDPFGERTLAAANPTLKGGGALTSIAQACSDYGVDAIACIADALHEGASGGMGDGGLAYGPFQDHLTEFADRPFHGKGRNNAQVNAWAWSDNGIRYSVRAMVNGRPSAKGLHGHAAVYAIVYGYEKPGDEAGAYKTRAAEYDHLSGLGSGWAAYAAPLFAGPAGGGATDTTPIGGTPSSPYQPAGVVAQWRDFVNVFRLTVPAKHAAAKTWSQALVEVFR